MCWGSPADTYPSSCAAAAGARHSSRAEIAGPSCTTTGRRVSVRRDVEVLLALLLAAVLQLGWEIPYHCTRSTARGAHHLT